MADKKVEEQGQQVIRLYASAFDSLFQDWLKKADANDPLGAALVSARIAQLGSMVSEDFHQLANKLCDGPTAARACDEAAKRTVDMIQKKIETIYSVDPSALAVPVVHTHKDSLN